MKRISGVARAGSGGAVFGKTAMMAAAASGRLSRAGPRNRLRTTAL